MKAKLLLLFVFFPFFMKSQIITTVAGHATWGYSGDGGLAINADLDLPCGVAFDKKGNLYIADQGNHTIRKIDTAGIITTICGTGVAGKSPDGGLAINAQIKVPSDIEIDNDGNIFICEGGRIRKIDATGIISTYAGGVADSVIENNPLYTGDGGPASDASIAGCTGITLTDDHIMYIATSYTLRKIDPNGIITTIAGKYPVYGSAGDGGLAINALLNQAYDVVTDSKGNIYISDWTGPTIRKITTDGIIHTVIGKIGSFGFSGDGGPAINAEIQGPKGIAIGPDNAIFIACENNNAIRRIDSNGIITTVAGNKFTNGFAGDGDSATKARLYNPYNICFDTQGNMFIADIGNSRIRKVSAPTSVVISFKTTKNGNWNDPSTWIGGVVPNATSKVTIEHNITVSSNSSCYSLNVLQPNGKITVNTGYKLNINH